MLLIPRTAVVVTIAFFSISNSLWSASDSRAWVTGPTERITLEQAIEMTLSNNLDAQIEREGFRIADARVHQAWGDFDPVLNLNTGREVTQAPQNPSTISNADAAIQERQFIEQAQLIALLQGP